MADVYRLDIDDTSPTVSYTPSADPLASIPNLLTGWNPYFTDSGFVSGTLGQEGNGTSQHLTSLTGATVSIQWFGTGIQLYGNATDATYDILLNGKPGVAFSHSTPDNILAAIQDLHQGNHTITLVAHPNTNTTSSFIAFDRALATVSSERKNATVLQQTVDELAPAFHGEWSFQRNLTASGQTFHTSNTDGDHASFSFTGCALYVNGFRDLTSGQYNVTLDGQTTMFNAQSSFREESLLFYATGLDNKASHDLHIVNAGDSLLAIGDIQVVTVSGGMSMSHSLSRGTIAALAVAGAIIFILVLAFALFIIRRRRRNSTLQRLRCFGLWPRTRQVADDPDLDISEQALEKSREASPVQFGAVFGMQQAAIDPNRKRRSVISWAPSPARDRASHMGERRGSETALLADTEDRGAYSSLNRPQPKRPPPVRPSQTHTRDPSIEYDLRQLALAEAQYLPQAKSGTSRPGPPAYAQLAPPEKRDTSHSFAHSFIDFASSAASSIRQRSISSSSGAPGTDSPSGTQRFKSSPDQISLSIQGPHASGAPSAWHSRHSSGEQLSPTESVPVTVSDIQFRPADEVSAAGDPASRRTSAQSQHAPQHPPVRTTPSPFIVQKLLGIGVAATPGPGAPPQRSPPPWPPPSFSPRSPGSSPAPRGPR